MKQLPEEQFRGAEVTAEDHKRARRTLLTVALFSIVMLFAGFTSAYIVSSSSTYWLVFDLPPAFLWSTILIVLSSGTMVLATQAIKKGNHGQFKLGLMLTLLLGVGFTVSQFFGWGQLVERGIYAVGDNRLKYVQGTYGEDHYFIKGDQQIKFEDGQYYAADDGLNSRPITDKVLETDNTASSYWYLFTVMHILHLLVGLIVLMVINAGAFRGNYSADNHNGVVLGARYWHFLGGLWVYLYLFLLIIH